MAAIWIIDDILDELKRAKKKHPYWPDHIVGAAGIVCEESGEVIRECLNLKYGKNTPEESASILENIRKELIQSCASAIRMLENLPKQ